ncbi:MAG: hypothetical protein L6R38_001003 [Xanthoria sp. 2 TBL-2021]|nr:MAG: hypothetical protein L6R38_001003 [Xanthoria sp. 2 TBL-2021]
MSDTDTTSAALNRAKSYFLVGAIVSNPLTFSLGPRLLDHEEAPDPDHAEGKMQSQVDNSPDSTQREQQDDHANGHTNGEATEDTSLLPEYIVRRGAEPEQNGYYIGKRIWDRLGPKTRSTLDLLYAFLNAPLVGAVVGAVIGLTPPLHRAFFDDPQHGGFFKAWLTSCIQNVGNIFAALQEGFSRTVATVSTNHVPSGCRGRGKIKQLPEEDEAWRTEWNHPVAAEHHSASDALYHLACHVHLRHIRPRRAYEPIVARSRTLIRLDVNACWATSNGHLISHRS